MMPPTTNWTVYIAPKAEQDQEQLSQWRHLLIGYGVGAFTSVVLLLAALFVWAEP